MQLEAAEPIAEMGSVQQLSLCEAIDLSHHLNAKSKNRHPSPLKDIIQYMSYDGMVSLAGGLPHPSLFPLQAGTVTCLAPTAAISSTALADRPKGDLVSLSFGRTESTETLDLTPYLQYGTGAGSTELREMARALTDRVHKPRYRYDVLLHPGNTNAWAKVVGMLCEDDDSILVEEFTYPSAQALWIPLGMKAVPVCADADGMSAKHLEGLLAGWDASRGRRPRVLYSVSIGSNPTGLTINAQRRQAIYDICVKYDVIIVEDDPYYFLQYPHYSRGGPATLPPAATTDAFIDTLTPSFLSLDVQGRVIRLESFSKTLFPGLRLGYFIANPLFVERLLRATEVETQDPAGLSQAFTVALLRAWKVDGYLSWMENIRAQYYTRRNWLLGAIAQHFLLVPAADSPLPAAQGWVACIPAATATVAETATLTPVFSFVDPTAGMFLWAKFYFQDVPRFAEIASTDNPDPEQAFSDELWAAWIKELVLLTPGSYYHPWQGSSMVTTKARGAEAATAHFRLSFASPTKEQIEQGIERLARVVKTYVVPRV